MYWWDSFVGCHGTDFPITPSVGIGLLGFTLFIDRRLFVVDLLRAGLHALGCFVKHEFGRLLFLCLMRTCNLPFARVVDKMDHIRLPQFSPAENY